MQKKNNVLGLDVGNVRIGVAIIADGVQVPRLLPAILNDEDVLARLQKIIDEKQIEQIVVGLPRNLRGDETAQTKVVRQFADKLKMAINLPVRFQDEALTSVSAEDTLRRSGMIYGKGEIDSLAACRILDDYISQVQTA